MTRPFYSIPAVYRDTTFRSRAEARWAIFFDQMGIGWAYEPEIVTIAGRPYLPDFRRLPRHLPGQ